MFLYLKKAPTEVAKAILSIVKGIKSLFNITYSKGSVKGKISIHNKANIFGKKYPRAINKHKITIMINKLIDFLVILYFLNNGSILIKQV